MSALLFAGPSVHGVDHAAFDGLELRPPAAAGDVLRAALDGATAIGLVDGVFGNAPSVWHKEILAALEYGVEMFGAASMGALRAVECSAFGMRGVGRIFSEYLTGLRTADADVAVLHGPAELGYKPLTLALVDAEITCEVLLHHGMIAPREGPLLVEAARALDFRERNWATVLTLTTLEEERRTAIRAAIPIISYSQKTQDALQLVSEMRACGTPRQCQLISGPFSRTDLFMKLQRRVSPPSPDDRR